MTPTSHTQSGYCAGMEGPIQFPLSSSAACAAIHDLCILQTTLSEKRNFAPQSSCEVFEISEAGTGAWTVLHNDNELRQFMVVSATASEPLCQISLILMKDNGVTAPRQSARYWFMTLSLCPEGTYKSQVSLSRDISGDFLSSMRLHPQFATFLLGQYGVHHMPTTDFQSFSNDGTLLRTEFISQQSRWGAEESRLKWFPISAYMAMDHENGGSTCLVTSSTEDARVKAIKARLSTAFPQQTALASGKHNARDAFLLPSLISHETFMQSDQRIIDIAKDLYETLDEIDAYVKGGFDRESLKTLTFKLHRISQDVDFLVSSAEIGITVLASMLDAKHRLQTMKQHSTSDQRGPSHGTSEYLRKAYESRKRWLLGAKQRKDTAMTLVYNLVAQQDIETNMAIARDTRNDSSSMKAIAILTMVFLPASSVSSFFGMGFFSNQGNVLQVAHQWWLFLIVTVPVTALVVAIWWTWHFSRCRKEAPEPGNRKEFPQLSVFRSVFGPLSRCLGSGNRGRTKEKDIAAV